jgi:hypothetical protein
VQGAWWFSRASNPLRVAERRPGWVRFPHASASKCASPPKNARVPGKKDFLKHPRNYSLLVLCAMIPQLFLAQNTTPQTVQPPAPQTSESNPKTWKEFVSKEGFFSVLLPGTPVQQIQRAGSAEGPLDYFSYTLQTEAHSYFVAYVDFPEVPNDVRGIIKILDGGRDGAIATINGKLISEVDFLLKGVPGRAITVEGANQLLKARIFLAELRLYLVMIVANKNQTTSPEISSLENATVERFLGSFKLRTIKKK